MRAVEKKIETSSSGEDDVTRLLERMREGDREALGVFLDRFGDRIRARVRLRMSPALRRLADSQDLLATVGRRLDRFVLDGKLRASGPDELWSLVMTTAHNAVYEKRRLLVRLNRVEGEDAAWARPALEIVRSPSREDEFEGLIDRALTAAGSDLDRAIISRWLAGDSLAEIASTLGLTPEATRQRWRAIRLRLRDALRAWGQDNA